MSIGFGFKDVPDPEEAGYASRVSLKHKYDWEQDHTCDKCGAKIKWVTRTDGKRKALSLKLLDDDVSNPSRFWLYRYQGNGRWGWAGTGPGYLEHVCPPRSR